MWAAVVAASAAVVPGVQALAQVPRAALVVPVPALPVDPVRLPLRVLLRARLPLLVQQVLVRAPVLPPDLVALLAQVQAQVPRGGQVLARVPAASAADREEVVAVPPRVLRSRQWSSAARARNSP